MATEPPIVSFFHSRIQAKNNAGNVVQVERKQVVTRVQIVGVSSQKKKELPPIVAQSEEVVVGKTGPNVDGILPRLLTARVPAQMINPLAPPEYGSAADLETFTELNPYRTSNANAIRLQSDGFRLLTLKSLW